RIDPGLDEAQIQRNRYCLRADGPEGRDSETLAGDRVHTSSRSSSGSPVQSVIAMEPSESVRTGVPGVSQVETGDTSATGIPGMRRDRQGGGNHSGAGGDGEGAEFQKVSDGVGAVARCGVAA